MWCSVSAIPNRSSGSLFFRVWISGGNDWEHIALLRSDSAIMLLPRVVSVYIHSHIIHLNCVLEGLQIKAVVTVPRGHKGCKSIKTNKRQTAFIKRDYLERNSHREPATKLSVWELPSLTQNRKQNLTLCSYEDKQDWLSQTSVSGLV